MKATLADALRCPACYSPLRLATHEAREGIVLEGTLTCGACAREYAIREGAAYLAVADGAWRTILKELINRREIIAENFRKPPAAQPTAKKIEQDKVAKSIADFCFEEIQTWLPKGGPLRVLDCGAGMCETAAWFAAQGHDVVATDTEISMVRYHNFAGPAYADPQPIAINGHTGYVRNPNPFPDYFSRMAADIQRLPFADGTFDAVFCRAMLHHVDFVGAAITEMARVLRPGGVLMVCAEPYRSVLDRESDFQEDAVDREEGMHEQAPTILAYRRPMAAHCDRVAIQYWPSDMLFRARRIFNALGIKPECRLHAGQVIEDWRWVKLWATAGAANLMGFRGANAAKRPRKYGAKTAPPITSIVEIYLRETENLTLESLCQNTESLKAIRRQLLNEVASSFPTSIGPGQTRGMQLESGWGPIITEPRGPHRCVGRRASTILRRPSSAKRCSIAFAMPSTEPESHEVDVILNGEFVGSIAAPSDDWEPGSFELPSDGLGIVQVEFRATDPLCPADRLQAIIDITIS